MELIKLSDATKAYMDVVMAQMDKIGVLEDADKANLDLLASQYELYIRALEDIEKKGLTCTDQRDRLAVNPSFSVARSCMTQITALMKELSISARQRRMLIRDEIVAEESPMDVFYEKMNNEF